MPTGVPCEKPGKSPPFELWVHPDLGPSEAYVFPSDFDLKRVVRIINLGAN